MSRTGTIARHGDHYQLRYERRLRHPPEKVWHALTDNDELRHWYPVLIEGERRAGAPLRFVFGPDIGPPPDAEMRAMMEAQQGAIDPDSPHTRGVMRVFDPPHALEYDWAGQQLRFELTPDGAGTLLVMIHTYADRKETPYLGVGWDFCIAALEARLDGVAPAPTTKAGFDEGAAAYAALLAEQS